MSKHTSKLYIEIGDRKAEQAMQTFIANEYARAAKAAADAAAKKKAAFVKRMAEGKAAKAATRNT